MTETTELMFRHPIAKKYADLAGVQRDLELTADACLFFATRPSVGSDENILVSRAIGTFAIVTYGRTFGSNVRAGIERSLIDDLPDDLQKVHREVKDMRDKFVAHSVNFDEDNVVNVKVHMDDSGATIIDSIGTTHTRLATFSQETMRDLGRLIAALKVRVQAEINAERDRIWDHLVALPANDLKAALSGKRPERYRPKDASRGPYGGSKRP